MKCVECGETKQAVEMVISRSVIVCSECASPASPPADPKCVRCGLEIGVYRGCKCTDPPTTEPAEQWPCGHVKEGMAGKPRGHGCGDNFYTEPAESQGKLMVRCEGCGTVLIDGICALVENGEQCPPAETEDAKAFYQSKPYGYWNHDGSMYTAMVEYATKHLERQTPAIERAAVEKAFERLRMMMGPRPADNTVRASIATILEEYGETE